VAELIESDGWIGLLTAMSFATGAWTGDFDARFTPHRPRRALYHTNLRAATTSQRLSARFRHDLRGLQKAVFATGYLEEAMRMTEMVQWYDSIKNT
jgi:hypothetical protein